MEPMVAFEINGEMATSDTPPATAEEYLMQVRYETNMIDNIMIATNRSKAKLHEEPVFGVKGISAIPIIPKGMQPSKEWEEEFMSEYIILKGKWEAKVCLSLDAFSSLEKIPFLNDKKAWRKFCFGEKKQPKASYIMQLDFVGVEKILTYHTRWAQSDTISPHHATWLYALLMRVPLPLSPRMGSELYALNMRCASIRSRLVDASDELVAHLNILITVLEKYFRQVLDISSLPDDSPISM